MSIASRQRQSIRDARLGRTKPAHHPRAVHNEYEPAPFDVTAFQDTAHKAAVRDNKKILSRLAGDVGRLTPRWLKAYVERVKFWPAWKRDGYESEVHYAVARRRAGLMDAAHSGDFDHPMWHLAQKAIKLNLIKI